MGFHRRPKTGSIRAMVAAGEHLSSSRPARRAKTRPAERIPVCVEPTPPFAEGPGPGRDWWEKALSEKSFRAVKPRNSQQNQGVGAKSRTTNLGPFGEVIRATGPMAKVNPFRFSTQYQDDETDLIMYPARPYNPSTGRWLTRDPAEEDGGPNLYGFVGNDPIAAVDPFGLATYTLSTGKQWAYSFGFISIGGANGLHVTITATSGDLCRFDGDPTVTPKLKNRWFWHKYSDNTTSKTYDSDRKCKDCRKVQCFKYHRDVTWQANSIVPRPLPRIFHMYQTVTVDFTICADGVGNSASSSGSQTGHNIDMFFTLEDF